MKLAFFGETAIECYRELSIDGLEKTAIQPDLANNFTPHAKSIEHARGIFPRIKPPLHCMVFEMNDRRNLPNMRCHLTSLAPFGAYPAWLYRIGPGLYLPPAELAYHQAARGKSIPSAALIAMELCASYRIDPATNEIVERDCLTTPNAITDRLAQFIAPQADKKPLKALEWVTPFSASPRETALALCLSLPNRHGGYGLPKAHLNFRIDIPKELQKQAHRRYFVVDACWPNSRCVAEYDSNKYHLSPEQHYSDIVKRDVLEQMGYKVIVITNNQVLSPCEMDTVARRIAKALGIRLRIRTQNFTEKQNDLWQILGLS